MLVATPQLGAQSTYPPIGVSVSPSANDAEQQPNKLTLHEALLVAATLRALHQQLEQRSSELARPSSNDEQRREQPNRAD